MYDKDTYSNLIYMGHNCCNNLNAPLFWTVEAAKYNYFGIAITDDLYLLKKSCLIRKSNLN